MIFLSNNGLLYTDILYGTMNDTLNIITFSNVKHNNTEHKVIQDACFIYLVQYQAHTPSTMLILYTVHFAYIS